VTGMAPARGGGPAVPGRALASRAVPVAIDARAAVRPELGGVERWARELCARLPPLGDYEVVRPPAALVHRAGHAWEQLVLPLRTARADALLCPANLAPLAARNAVVVIHDAAALRHPAWYSRAYAGFQRRVLPLIARRARRVITVSEFSAAELRELLHVDADVVYGGVDTRFTPRVPPARRPRPYVLCVASQTARKNLAALVPAARALRGEVDVVVAGGHRPQFAAERGLEPLVLLGHVDDADLPGLYAGALAFALPSLYEGFGLPVLEAMACGTPVLAANAAALPETCGGAARLVEPGEWEAALTDIAGDASARERLRAAGLARAAAFSWERTAREVDALLRA
jgi:glycosyltransferase involved in cell wall biosynthesis